MNRKDIKIVAAMIRKQVEGEAVNSHKFGYMRQLAKDFADHFEAQPELFCRDIFFSHCGIEEDGY